jgi:hypothetical protein
VCSWSSCSVHVKLITPVAIIFDILNQKRDKVHKKCLDTMKTVMVMLLLLLLLMMMMIP